MADTKTGLKRSGAFLVSGIAAGGLSFLLRDPSVAQFISNVAQTDIEIFSKGLSYFAGLYSVAATTVGAVGTPYYGAKYGLEKIFGTGQ